MKKSKILIAAFAVMAAASAASAEEPRIDFDGGKNRVSGFSASVIGIRAEKVHGAFSSQEYIGQQGKNFRELSRYYTAQSKIKSAAVNYYSAKNNMAAAYAFAAKDVRVAVERGVVYLVASGKVNKIDDPELAGTIIEIIRPQSQNKLIDPLTGVLIIVSCMQDDPCWDAVGDGVSAISEWLNS